MPDISNSDYSETDASNNQTAPNGFPEGTAPSLVDDWGRATWGGIKRFWNRVNPTVTASFSGGAYTYTVANATYPGTYVQGETFTFRATSSCVGSDTLNVNSLGALGIYKSTSAGPAAVAAGDIQANSMVSCAYDVNLNGGSGGFQLIGGIVALTGTAAIAAPNKLINPFMEIDQINEGSSTSPGAGAYAIDGWKAGFTASGAAVTVQRVTDAPTGYPNSIKLTVGTGGTIAGGSYLLFQQPIEANELIDTAFGTAGAQSMAVTFWLKASIAGTYSGSLQNFAQSRSYPFNVTLASSGTWTKFSVIIPGDTAGTWVTSGTAGGMFLNIAATAGSNFQGTVNTWATGDFFGTSSNTNTILSTTGATFQLGPAKLEVSASATPIVPEPFEIKLARCQRYLEKSYDLGTKPGTATTTGAVIWHAFTGTDAFYAAIFKVTKRSDGSGTVYSSNSGSSGNIFNTTSSADDASTAAGGVSSTVLSTNVSISQNSIMQAQWVQDSRL